MNKAMLVATLKMWMATGHRVDETKIPSWVVTPIAREIWIKASKTSAEEVILRVLILLEENS